jgi:hypothetical protein
MRSIFSPFRMGYLLSAMVLGAAPMVARAAHPFVTDDTSTQGAGNWQLELLGQRDRNDRLAVPGGGPVRQRTRSTTFNPVATYGLLEALDVALGLNYQRYRVSDNGVVTAEARAAADSTLELKWRFYERDALTLALKPGLQLPTGDEDRGLGTGRMSWGAAFIAAYDAKPWSLLGNVAYFHPRFKLPQDADGSRGHLWRVSGGASYTVRGDLKLVGELGVRTNPSRNDPFAPGRKGQFAMVGAIYSPSNKIDLDIGLRKGLNRAETDTALLVGAAFRW